MSIWYWPSRNLLVLYDKDQDIFKEWITWICDGVYCVYDAVESAKLASELFYIGEL